MTNQDKVKSVLNNILETFRNGDIPEALSVAVFPTFDIPMSKWSLANRLLAVLTGTEDARGFRQWKEVGRWVKKGAKSFTILAPRKKILKEKDDSDEDQKRQRLIGFLAVPVFRVEDTEGEPLDHEKLELPQFPLIQVAKAWGIETKAVSGSFTFYGAFNPELHEIHLASPEEMIFFHELAHAAHHRFQPLKGGQHWNQEIVAELSAACLCRLVGRSPENLGHAHQYISDYAKKAKLTAVQGCIRVIHDVEKVVNLILSCGRKASNN